jgi:hypothetical protein
VKGGCGVLDDGKREVAEARDLERGRVERLDG